MITMNIIQSLRLSHLLVTIIMETVATEGVLVTKMIESILGDMYTAHVMLHEVLTADCYEPSEVSGIIGILVSFSFS